MQIAVRDITVRYRQTALGGAWAVLQPVGFMVVFSLFFGNVAGVSSDGLPYAALQPRRAGALDLLLQRRCCSAPTASSANSALVSKIYFPRIFMPAGVVVAGFVDLAISFVILIVIVRRLGLRALGRRCSPSRSWS